MPTHPMQSPMSDIRRNCDSIPDYIIYRINKKLGTRSMSSDNMWWDAFASDFFEDDATLTIKLASEEDMRNCCTIGRTLIPRFFRSLFDRGVTDLYFVLNQPRNIYLRNAITVECDDATMVSDHGTSYPVKIYTEGKLTLDMTCDESMRIRRWIFTIKKNKEYIEVNHNENGSFSVTTGPGQMHFSEAMPKNSARRDLVSDTMKYLRVCVTLELMQELMSRQKSSTSHINPRECLNFAAMQKSQAIGVGAGVSMAISGQQSTIKAQDVPQPPVAPMNDEPSVPVQNKQTHTKKRKRRPSSTGTNISSTKKKSPDTPNVVMSSQDVMIVGEPSLMGGDLGEDDERMIKRLMNDQYDGSNGLDDDELRGSPLEPSHMSPWNSERKQTQDDKGVD